MMRNALLHDPAAFIRAETRLQPVPHVPEISLHLADEAVPLWQRTEEEMGQLGLPPPFWAFAWAGGQALARYILDNRTLVAGKRVLDFASGSGLVGVAAAMAGASRVTAADIDPFAVAAISLNAVANGVSVDVETRDLIGERGAWDVVLAGDICYQRDIAERVSSWLAALHAEGTMVQIGDPGRAYLPKDTLVSIAEYDIPVTRAIEDGDVKRTMVWLIRRA